MSFWPAFLRGVNYWPARKAMYWWKDFDLAEVQADFSQMILYNLDVVRFFLNWEDFQPRPDIISYHLLDDLKRLADLAYDLGIYLMPTFFCGHMSGVNWMPEWMLCSGYCQQRFPVYSSGRLTYAPIRNYYQEDDLINAQLLLIRSVCGALADHPAILSYDLGNESSNCVLPGDRNLACQWLRKMTSEIKANSPDSLITLGMHAEDLEEDRNLWPQDAACYCDFLSMHGYPFYLSWVEDTLDYRVLSFLGIITQWLGKKEVLFQEFGVPTHNIIPPEDYINNPAKYSCPLSSEGDAADYYQAALPLLDQSGMLGAMAWDYTDYHPSLWHKAPLKDNPHERHFGLFRYDGSPKPAAQVWRSNTDARVAYGQPGREGVTNLSWLSGYDPEKFYDNPQAKLARLFSQYKDSFMKGTSLR